LPGQRSLLDSDSPVHRQTRPTITSGSRLPTSETHRRPDHGRGAPAGAARPAVWVGGTHPPTPFPPPKFDGFIENRGHQHAHHQRPGGGRPHNGRRRRPTPAPLTNYTLLLLARVSFVTSFFRLFVVLLLLYWTKWLSTHHQQVLTARVLNASSSLPDLVVRR